MDIILENRIGRLFRWPLVWILGLVGFPISQLGAQDKLPEEEVYMGQLGVKEGLSAGLVYKVTQDQRGYLWMATKEGLNRYDGYRIKTYEHDAKDSLSLPEDHVTFIHVDSRDWLWLTTRNLGLAVMDFSNENFIPLNIPANNIQEDQWGNIWLNGDGGRLVLEIPPEIVTPSGLLALEKPLAARSPQQIYTGLPEDKFGSEVIFAQKQQMWVLLGDSLYHYQLDFTKRRAQLQLSLSLDRDSLFKGKRGAIMIEDKARDRILFLGRTHVYAIDQSRAAFQKVVQVPPHEEFLLPHEVLEPKLVDSYGQLWCSSFYGHYGLYKLDLETLRWKAIKRESGNIFEDRHGVIWFSTSGFGVLKYTPAHAAFHYFGNDHEGPSLYDFVELKTKRVGRGNAGAIIDLETKLFGKVLDIGRPSRNLIALIKDEQGPIWASFRSPKPLAWQLHKFDSSGKFIQSYPKKSLEDGPFAANILLMGADRTLWSVVSNDLEWSQPQISHVFLDCWQPEGMNPARRFVFEAPAVGFLFGKCQAIYQGPDHHIWLGLDNGGLLIFDPSTENWRHFTYDASDPYSLPSNRVFSLLPDPKTPTQIMWVGTSKGLAKMDMKTGTFTTYTPKDGLPDEVIYGILADERNNLWFSTNHGLGRFDPVTMEVRIYTEDDGLQHTEFNRGAYLKRSDGTMFFGGVGGLTWFDPKELSVKRRPANVVINGFRLNNEPVEYRKPQLTGDETSLLHAPVDYMQEIVLRYDQRFLTFEFTSLDLTRPSNNRFQCKLEGLSDNWTAPSQQPEITFTNLDPGRYTFWVRGTNYQGEWSEQLASIHLRILPPWWGTWWFRLSMGALVALGIYSLIRFRQRTRKNLEDLRNRISQDLHDEIGSTLSSISLFGMVAGNSIVDDPEKTRQLLMRINSNATQTIESMNDIVWAIKAENDSMLHLISRMRSYASELEETGEWDIQIHYNREMAEKNLDMIQRRNIYLIFKEAINNAVKYSAGDAIRIEIKPLKNLIRIEIKDNGKGFETEKELENGHTFGGNGLKNMKRRAEELGGNLKITSGLGQGTSIMLTFSSRHNPKIH